MPGTLLLTPPATPLIPKEKNSKIKIVLAEVTATNRDDLATYLPSVRHCAAHLRLLESFFLQRVAVEKLAVKHGVDSVRAWDAYVELGAARFTLWANGTMDTADPPAVDVLMVWHAFMLNPVAYSDFERVVGGDRFSGSGVNWDQVEENLAVQTSNLPEYLATASGLALWMSLASRKETLARNVGAMESLDRTVQLAHARIVKSKHTYAGPEESDFAFALSAAVHRQFGFVQHMVRHAWLQSPAAESTLANAVTRYKRFWSLLTAGRGFVSPTLDIDLAWHTHQLWPAAYRAYSAERCGGRLIDHDDAITDEQGRLAFAKAEHLYGEMFDEEYAICSCWACELVRAGPAEDSFDVVGEDWMPEQSEHALDVAVADEMLRRLALGLPEDCIYTCGGSCSKP